MGTAAQRPGPQAEREPAGQNEMEQRRCRIDQIIEHISTLVRLVEQVEVVEYDKGVFLEQGIDIVKQDVGPLPQLLRTDLPVFENGV